MEKITIEDWADERNISYATAHARFEKGLIPNSSIDDIGEVSITEEYNDEEFELMSKYESEMRLLHNKKVKKEEQDYIASLACEELEQEKITEKIQNYDTIGHPSIEWIIKLLRYTNYNHYRENSLFSHRMKKLEEQFKAVTGIASK